MGSFWHNGVLSKSKWFRNNTEVEAVQEILRLHKPMMAAATGKLNIYVLNNMGYIPV